MSEYDEEYYLKGTKSGYGGKFSPYTEEYYLPIARHYAKIFIDIFNPKTVMELGCARGYLTMVLRRMNIEAYGIDISEWAINNAPEEVKKYIELGNVCNMSKWKDRMFDLVIAKDVLEHIQPNVLSKALDETIRIAKKYIYVYVPIIDNGKDKTHVSIHSSKWWKREFINRNFMIISESIRKQIDGITALELVLMRKN